MKQTLYKRNKNGSIQEWTIELDANRYRTIYGKHGGALITSEWTEAEQKNVGRVNETTAEEQAALEFASKITEQIDKQHYFKNINDIDNVKFIEPMLAKKWDDYENKIEYPVFSDPKLDGGRGIFSYRGLQTRKGIDIISTPHLILALYPLLEDHPGIVLDGELYNHDLRHNLNKIMSLIRKTKAENLTVKALEESANIIQYWVYDGWGFNGVKQNTPFEERKAALWDLLNGYNKSIVVVKSRKLHSPEEVDDHYQDLVKNEFEGQIIRHTDCPYVNKRTSTLLKRKDFQDDEFEIVRFEDGVGKARGKAHTAILRTKDGVEFGAGMNYSEAECKKIWEDPSWYIGKNGHVRFLKYSEYGVPLIPKLITIRHDI